MTEEEQEKLYELLFKNTKNKLEAIIEKQQKEIEELKKYDYRNIKINKNNELSSIHFTKEQLDLMNLGIALYINIFKESEDEIKELKEKNASLQKEIEELKKPKYLYNANTGELTRIDKEKQNNYISKDKIREHLKKFEEIEKDFIFIDNKSTAREINKALIEFSKRLLEE